MSKLGEILTTVSWEQLPSCLVATMKMKSVCTLILLEEWGRYKTFGRNCVCLSNRSRKTSKCGKNNQWHTRLGLVCHSNGCGRRWGVLPVIWVCKKAQKQHFDVPVTCHWTDTQHDGMYLLNKISLFGLVLKAYIMFMTGFFSTELKNVLVLLPPIMIFFSSVITFIYLFIYLFIYYNLMANYHGKY